MTQSIATLLRRSQAVLTKLYGPVHSRKPLTIVQIELLRAYRDHGKLNQREAIRLTGIGRSTMTQVVRLLRREGYLQMEASADVRALVLSITAEGKATLRVCETVLAQAERDFLHGLPGYTRKQLFHALDCLVPIGDE